MKNIDTIISALDLIVFCMLLWRVWKVERKVDWIERQGLLGQLEGGELSLKVSVTRADEEAE